MADYNYMQTPRIKNQGGQQPTGKTQPLSQQPQATNRQNRASTGGGDTPFHALGSPTPASQNMNMDTYKPTTSQLPPARDTSNPYANIQQPGSNPASGFGNPTSTYNGGNNSPLTTGGNTSQWNLPAFKPSTNYTPIQGQTQTATPGGGSQNYWDSANPWRINPKDQTAMNYMQQALPVAQFDQNNYQYANDFNAAKERWNAEFGLTQNQTAFQQQLSTQQQLAAEQQAAIAANQWNQQFGHTQQMDVAGLGLSQQQINNQYAMGMDQNQAGRDVANTYANSNMYQANQQLAGQQYQADRGFDVANVYGNAQMYGADQQLAGQLGSAGMYSDAQRYQALMGYQGQVGSANIYAGAQNYGADQQLAGQLGSANIYGGAQRYQADQGLAGQLGSAGLYSDAQRFQALQQLAGTQYGWNTQAAMNQAQMANNLAVANTQAYGRSQAPTANWAKNWG